MNCDIAIIGGGLAGVSCAHAIACEAKLDIVLLERRKIGFNNPTPLTFSQVIEEYDLEDCVKAHYSSFAFHNFEGSLLRFLFNDFPLVALDYQKACSKYLERILQRESHVSVVQGFAVKAFQKDRSVSIELEDGRNIEASIVIDCSGKSQFGLAQFSENHISHYSHPFGAIFKNVDLQVQEDLAYFLWPNGKFGSGGGWFYPLPQRKASFGYAVISKERKISSELVVRGYHLALKEFEPYCEYLKSAEVEYIETGTIPLTYVSKLVHGRMLLVGDAGGMATNWTCMGVEPALRYGKLAGSIAAKAVLNADVKLLQEFESIWFGDNRKTYDQMNSMADRFWSSGSDFWEWITLNDLAHLSPIQIVERMRWNDHLPNKLLLLLRALLHKGRSIVNRDARRPRSILIGS